MANEAVKEKKKYKTLDLKPAPGEMIKPAETIDIIGLEDLNLQDRRAWNALIANAFGPRMREDERDWEIDLNDLRSNHNSNERVEDSIERLMKTVARCRMPNGAVKRFQLLGGNDLGDPTRPRGVMTYSFDKRLIEVLRDSTMFGKLELSVMYAFSSKYALALYEHLSRKVNLSHKWMENYSVEEFREILGVGAKQYPAFGNLKQRVIVPALKEVNFLAPFSVTMGLKKKGQRVTDVSLSWVWKSRENREKVRRELDRSKHGRKARMAGIKETVIILSPDGLATQDHDSSMDDSDKAIN